MQRLALVALTLSFIAATGCATLGTSRPSGGAQIQRTADPAPNTFGELDAKPELGQR